MMHHFRLLSFLCVFVGMGVCHQTIHAQTTQPATSQPAVVDAMKLNTSVLAINDRRSSIPSVLQHCSVDLLFESPLLSQVIGIDQITVTKAIDNLGNDLVQNKQQKNRSLGQDNFLSSHNPANSVNLSVILKNPARQAKQIKTLRGIAHFVLQSADGEDSIAIADFLEPTNEPVKNELLAKRNVQLVYLPPAWISQWATAKKAKHPFVSQEELAGLLPLIQGISKQSDRIKLIPIAVVDPDEQVALIQISTLQGQLKKMQFEHITVFLSMTGMPENPVMQVNLKSEATTMKLPFEVHEIELP